MSDVLNVNGSHPSGMHRLNVDVWVSDADLEYITGALVERDVSWEDFVKAALIEAASR